MDSNTPAPEFSQNTSVSKWQWTIALFLAVDDNPKETRFTAYVSTCDYMETSFQLQFNNEFNLYPENMIVIKCSE